MANLYQLADNYKKFHDYVEDVLESDEELSEEDLQTFIETLESVEDSLEHKLENIAKFLKNLDSDQKAFEEEKKRLDKKAKTLKRKIEGIKDWTKFCLETNGIDKIKVGTFSLRLQKNNPSVEIIDESAIPAEYKVPQPDEIMKSEILKVLKSGEEVPGAKIADEKKHLRIT